MKNQRSTKTRRHAKTFVFTKSSGEIKRFGWADLALSPDTPQSEFCVISGNDGRSKSLIERSAAELVSSTEGFANECRSLSLNDREIFKFFFNVIVTTAKIKRQRKNHAAPKKTVRQERDDTRI